MSIFVTFKTRNKMAAIPTAELQKIQARLAELKPWLGHLDYKKVAEKLKSHTHGTIAQIARGNRFHLDVAAALIEQAEANIARVGNVVGSYDKKTAEAVPTKPEPTSSLETAENAPAELGVTAKKPSKPRPKKPQIVEFDETNPEHMRVAKILIEEGAVTVVPDTRLPRKKRVEVVQPVS